ncbi:MAG: hypothetical protein GY694_21630, partial [Gammaproteobacteria bacterium]|nr:hypothetical protein [Gammaproteobacteria bacterium]
MDSPVSNIGYRTDTKEGVTNSLGEYDYIPGETVTFFIGDLEFPPVPAAGVVTPLDMAGTNDTTDTTLINIARLLQTLDSDGDPSTNGIVISEQAHKSAQNLTVDFSSPSFDNDVQFLVSNSGSPTTSLIDQADAIAHLSENVQCPDTPKTLKDYLVGKRIIVGSDFVELNYDGTVVDQYVEDGETSRVTGTYEING